ncbi:MAG: hypothetical protein QE271_04920 [Bacteriovoracaceae bacterium]|nr:hypothetical protein [Bacteriovoracaceae bacterium]
MNWKKKLFTIVVMSTFAHQLFAEPSLEPDTAALANLTNVINKTQSNVIADETNPKLFHVLPPNAGYGYTQGLTSRTANMGFCEEMSMLQEYSRNLLTKIGELEIKKAGLDQILVPLNIETAKLREKASKFATENQMIALANLESVITSQTDRLDVLYEKREKCQGTLCDAIDAEIASVYTDKVKLEKQRSDAIKEAGDSGRQYKKLSEAAQAKENLVSNYKKPYDDIQASIWETKDKYFKAYKTYGSLEGAQSYFTYESGWAENVKALRDANPDFTFEFAKTKNLRITPELMIKNLDPTSSIIQTNIPGQETVNGVGTLASFTGTISANVVLSNIGACPIEHPEKFKLSINDNKAKFGIVATYDYSTIFKSKVTGHFNMRKVLSRVEETSSKRRLFNSSTTRTVSTRNDYNDLITFAWEDRSNSITPDVKAKKEDQIRESIFNRIAYLAVPQTNERAKVINPGSIPPSGASVISSTLMDTCPGNAYCVGAAVGLQILDNIFGGGKTTGNFTSIIDLDLTEVYSNIGSIDHSASIGYKLL